MLKNHSNLKEQLKMLQLFSLHFAPISKDELNVAVVIFEVENEINTCLA